MSDKVIYFTEKRGSLVGHILPYSFVDQWSDEQIKDKLEALEKEGYQDLKVGAYSEYEQASKKASLIAYKAYQPQPSNAEHFNEMFNILPPQNHLKMGDSELFRISEQLSDGLYTFHVRLDAQYFEIVAERNAESQQLFDLCLNIASNKLIPH